MSSRMEDIAFKSVGDSRRDEFSPEQMDDDIGDEEPSVGRILYSNNKTQKQRQVGYMRNTLSSKHRVVNMNKLIPSEVKD